MTEQTMQEQKPADGAAEKTDEAKPEIKPIQLPPEPEHEFFEPSKLRLFGDGSGRTRATINGDRSYLDVKLVRSFPQTIPDRFWALAYQDNRVIGVIEDPEALDKESYQTALACLETHYFAPIITAIRSLKEEFGAMYFEVETDRGPRSFVATGVRDGIEDAETGKLILVDVDENRYRIPDWQSLDAESQRFLERII